MFKISVPSDEGPVALLRRAARLLDLEAETSSSHAEQHELKVASAELECLAQSLPARFQAGGA